MIKSVRNKFVLVTTTLMITVFCGFLVINTVYNNFLNGVEITRMLDWIAYSGIFTSPEKDISREEFIREITRDENPIVGIVLDKKGKVLTKSAIGGEDVKISGKLLRKMCRYKDTRYRVGRYYYSYTELSEHRVLLVLMDSSVHGYEGLKLFGIIILIVVGTLILILVTLLLSGFVTKPAEQMLLREKRFISDASHELKTPLGAISINAQALELEDKDNLYIRNIISEASRMSRLIERLLTLSKYDEQGLMDERDLVLSTVCEEMSLTYESVAFEKKVQFTYEIEPELHIRGNEDEIRQLLAILLDNALKNTEERGRIELSCKKVRNHCELKVSNTGLGISEEDLPHVFERFYTTSEERDPNSFGLGLAIAKSIVERHGGTISVSSTLGKITTFDVIF